MDNPLRNLPSVNDLLQRPPLRKLVERANRNVVVDGVRTFLDNLRGEVQSAASEIPLPSASELAEQIAQWILREEQPPLRPVINATGVLLHTGLGRAPLAEEALAAVSVLGRGYASLEVDLATGERSQRTKAVEKLLQELTGAEAAAVVNNNAAATLLTLAALAAGREVLVSRGQLIEIGGSYRLPDVMSASGAVLREVGTTNKTRLDDYRAAIRPETGAILRVHTSNYKIVGFCEQPTLAELVELGRVRNLPVIDDIGSGALIDFGKYGFADEPLAGDSIRHGADLVLFSGDKLLGGPQCGVIVGKKLLVERIVKHPLMRALRVDKMTLAALAATLELYRDPVKAARAIPLLAFLETPLENLKNRAQRIAPQLAASPMISNAEAIEGFTYLGGGAMPTQQIATWCVAVKPKGKSLNRLAADLRTGQPAIFGRLQNESLILDLRTVPPRHDIELVTAFEALPEPPPETPPAA